MDMESFIIQNNTLLFKTKNRFNFESIFFFLRLNANIDNSFNKLLTNFKKFNNLREYT